MAVADDITRLTAILARQLQGGMAEALRQRRGLTASAIGKACGASASVVYSWELGTSMPTTQQALAWMTALYEMAPSPITAMNRSAAADVEHQAAERAKQPAKPVETW